MLYYLLGFRPEQSAYHAMNAANQTLAARNQAWGFYGTICHHADPANAWMIATKVIGDVTGGSDEGVRGFLDGREGRHFADDVASGLSAGLAIDRAVRVAADRWMGWAIGRRTSRETGIPKGLPYLTGFVIHYEILADAAA